MSELPEPHPLDFDWRFDDRTTTKLCELLPKDQPVLAIGAPSVARLLEAQGRQVVLIDRQPLQGVKNHLTIEAGGQLPNLLGYKTVILDPPWYVAEIKDWTSWASHLIGVGGEIVVSLWPDGTRPTALSEIKYLFEWFSAWASIDEMPLVPRYVCPTFEDISQSRSAQLDVERSPRFGRLIKLRLHALPLSRAINQKTERWLRLVLNNYQLALRLHEADSGLHRLERVPGAINWQWPHVSRRAENRSQIDLWSSHNEVAIVKNPAELADDLRNAIESKSELAFLSNLASYPELRGWDIPRPPYWRRLVWRHLQ